MPGWAVWSVPDLQPPGCESVWPPRTPQPGQQIWTITTAIFSSAAVHLHESVQIFDRCSNTQLGPWFPTWVSSDSWALFWPLAPYLSEFRFLISVLAPSSASSSIPEWVQILDLCSDPQLGPWLPDGDVGIHSQLCSVHSRSTYTTRISDL